MARMGMDVEAVERSARDLKARAGDLEALIGEIDRIVQQLPSIWDGKDANTFVNDWWPGHKKNLVAVKESIAGLGQSAANNAEEQRQVSGR